MDVPAHPTTVGPPRRRTRRITEQVLADAVVGLGFTSLTIERVAERIGVTHSSLYKHIRSRDDLVRIAVGRIIAGLDPPLPHGWRDLLESESTTVWDVLERHDGLALELTVQAVPPAIAIERGAKVISLLVADGFAPDDATLALDLVIDLAFDVAIRSHHMRAHNQIPADGPTDREWFERKLAVVLSGIATDLAPGRPTPS